MEIRLDKIHEDKLKELTLEICALIETGSIKVGAFGLSPDSAEFAEKFNKGIGFGEQIVFDDNFKIN